MTGHRFPLEVVVDPRLELEALAKYAGTFEYRPADYDPGCSGCNVSLHACMFGKGAACCPECRHAVVREVDLDAAVRTLLERGHGSSCTPPDGEAPGVCRCELLDLAEHLRGVADEALAIPVPSPGEASGGA